MDIHVTDDQIGRYFRRRQLGLRLLAHGARPQTVEQWSGLTNDQLTTLRRRWAIAADDGPRGPSPSSFGVFFSSRQLRRHAALFSSLCQIMGVIPTRRGKDVADRIPSLENGERLCETFELLKEWSPDTTITFEQAVLLALGVAEENAIRLKRCESCGSAALIDQMKAPGDGCANCRKRSRSRVLLGKSKGKQRAKAKP